MIQNTIQDHEAIGDMFAMRQEWVKAAHYYDAKLSGFETVPDVMWSKAAFSYMKAGDKPAALLCARTSLAMNPANGTAHLVLGTIALFQDRDLSEATRRFRAAYKTNPDNPAFYSGLALSLLCERDIEGHLAVLSEAVRRNPVDFDSRRSIAMTQMLSGNWTEGLDNYEARLATQGGNAVPADAPEIWNGQPLEGKSIAIYAEQGIGDAVQFCRMVKTLKWYTHLHKTVIVCRPALIKLLSALCEADHVQSRNTPLVIDCDYSLPMMSIPHRIMHHMKDMWPTGMYRDNYRHKPFDVIAESAKLDGDYNLKVGLCWQGSRHHPNDAQRSIPFDAIEASGLLNVRNAKFFSLQFEGDKYLTPAGLHETGFGTDLVSLAKSISAMDLVITVDTATAHIAGALGVPVWTMISWLPDWRWGMDGTTTKWYKSMALYRQALADRHGWLPVLYDVKEDLINKISRRLSAS